MESALAARLARSVQLMESAAHLNPSAPPVMTQINVQRANVAPQMKHVIMEYVLKYSPATALVKKTKPVY